MVQGEQVLVLQRTAAFRGLPVPLLERLLEGSLCLSLKRGELLFTEGDVVARVFIMVSGSARTFCWTSQSREFTVAVLSARAVLGVQSLLSAERCFTVSAQMLEVGLVLSLDAPRLESLLLENVALANALLRFVVSRSGALLRRVDQVFFADLNARLSRVLLENADSNGWLLPPNSLLASELGTVPELVSRKLGEFYRLGLIRLEKRRVWIINPDALSDLLELP